MSKIVSEVQHVIQMHEFHIDKEDKIIRFDIVVSFDAKDRNEVHKEVLDKVQSEFPDYTIQIAMDMDFSE